MVELELLSNFFNGAEQENKFYNMLKPTQIETNWWVCYVTYVDIYMGVRIKVTAAWYDKRVMNASSPANRHT